MRRAFTLVGAVALVAVSVSPVAAARAQRFSDTQTVVACDRLQNESGTVLAFAVESETQGGAFGGLEFWAGSADPTISNPTWISGLSTVTFSGTSVVAMYELFEFAQPTGPDDPPFGDPVGTAVLDVTIEPVGDPEPFSFRDRQGNHIFRISGVTQRFDVAGTLELPEGITYDAADCLGFRDTFTQFSNAPASSVFRSREFVVSCMWTVDETLVFLFASTGPFGTFADVGVFGPDRAFSGFSEGVQLTTTAFSASLEKFEQTEAGLDGPVGEADAAASFSPTRQRLNERFSFDNVSVHITGKLYSVDGGTLNVSTSAESYSLPMDNESCFAADQRVKQHERARAEPPA